MLTLQERAVNAANGEEGDIEMLKLMGISAKNARGELKNADSLLLELADRVKQMRDAGEMGKAAGIMNQLGGEEGARLLDLLQNGRSGLLAMRREARELGLVLADDDVQGQQGLQFLACAGCPPPSEAWASPWAKPFCRPSPPCWTSSRPG